MILPDRDAADRDLIGDLLAGTPAEMRAADLRRPRSGDGSRLRAGSSLHGDALERLAQLRRILPLLGEELATARREAARLRLENRRLSERMMELERLHSASQTLRAPRAAKGA